MWWWLILVLVVVHSKDDEWLKALRERVGEDEYLMYFSFEMIEDEYEMEVMAYLMEMDMRAREALVEQQAPMLYFENQAQAI